MVWPLELLKRDPAGAPTVIDRSRLDDDAGFERIRCPHCGWHPHPSSTWCCDGPDGNDPSFAGCSTVWNTFTTRGRCPGCSHLWSRTICLRCGDWAPHEDWYEWDTSP